MRVAPLALAIMIALTIELGCQAPRAAPPNEIPASVNAPTANALTANAPTAIPLNTSAPPAPSAEVKGEPEIDPDAWLAERGVSRAQRDTFASAYGCREARLGAPAEAAIVCAQTIHVERGKGPARVYRVLARRRAWVVRGARPALVFDVVESVSPLDRIDPDSPNLIDLRAALAPDGLSATVSEDAGACDAARAQLDAQQAPEGSAWVRFDRELVERACAARGSWIWRRDRFAQDHASPR